MSRPLPRMTDAELLKLASDDEPGLGALRTTRGNLPLRALEVEGRIDGLLSQVRVRQTFVNAFDEPLEATYVFPLPDRAAVRGFRMEVAGRTIEGVLEEREQARRNYERAIQAGQRAAIAEEERPDVFTLRVGNLMPGEQAVIHLDLAGVLPYSHGEVTFRFPMVVAPRYIPGAPLPGPSVGDGTAVDTDAVPDASRISPPVLLPGFPNPVRLALSVDLHDHAGQIRPDHIRSSLHAIVCEENGEFLRVRLEPGDRLDRDFILRFRLGSEDPADPILSSLTLHPDPTGRDAAGAFALTLIPPAGLEQARRPRDVVFVLDRSGSMGGWKIVAARRALGRMIDTLNDDDRFCVIAFDDRMETLPGSPTGLVAATDRQRFRALEHLARLDARGGTEMAEPLKKATALLIGNGPPSRKKPLAERREAEVILVLITDGQVGNEDQILHALAPTLASIRVFTLGIDQAVNAGFLRRLAELGHGACELVESEERLDEVMAAVHRQIGTPMLINLAVEAEGFELEPDSLVPGRLPDLFAGAPLLLLGRYRGRPEGSLQLRATDASHRPWSATLAGVPRDNPAITAAWARGQVRKLEDRYAVASGDHAQLERQIVAVSLRHGVLSRFTAFVAIDRAEVANTTDRLHRITQPVEQPSGWEEEALLARSLNHPAVACYASPEVAFDLDADACFDMVLPPARAARAKKSSLGDLLGKHLAGGRPAIQRDDLREGMPPSAGGANDLAGILSRLRHPALESVSKAGAKGRRSLTEVMARERPEVADAARIVAEIAEAIQYLFDQGLLLGELSPEQVIVTAKGQALLAGLADHAVVVGSPRRHDLSGLAYAPPEALSTPPAPPDIRGTVYSLGALLFELLTGTAPFGGPVPSIVAAKPRGGVVNVPPDRVGSIPAELQAICLKAMAHRPEDRHATAGELAQALRSFLGSQPGRKKSFWKRG